MVLNLKNNVRNLKCVFLGYKRSIRNQKMDKARMKINCQKNIEIHKQFLGKKLKICNTNSRKKNVGKITALHGRSNVFIAKFKKPLSPNLVNSEFYILI